MFVIFLLALNVSTSQVCSLLFIVFVQICFFHFHLFRMFVCFVIVVAIYLSSMFSFRSRKTFIFFRFFNCEIACNFEPPPQPPVSCFHRMKENNIKKTHEKNEKEEKKNWQQRKLDKFHKRNHKIRWQKIFCPLAVSKKQTHSQTHTICDKERKREREIKTVYLIFFSSVQCFGGPKKSQKKKKTEKLKIELCILCVDLQQLKLKIIAFQLFVSTFFFLFFWRI